MDIKQLRCQTARLFMPIGGVGAAVPGIGDHEFATSNVGLRDLRRQNAQLVLNQPENDEIFVSFMTLADTTLWGYTDAMGMQHDPHVDRNINQRRMTKLHEQLTLQAEVHSNALRQQHQLTATRFWEAFDNLHSHANAGSTPLVGIPDDQYRTLVRDHPRVLLRLALALNNWSVWASGSSDQGQPVEFNLTGTRAKKKVVELLARDVYDHMVSSQVCSRSYIECPHIREDVRGGITHQIHSRPPPSLRTLIGAPFLLYWIAFVTMPESKGDAHHSNSTSSDRLARNE
ncbi:hypothetical protein OIO90_004594 [Microbotryomycetes sp. JL221]|nr:hypothetical protein OIO90_004594 [Microbotryomycetes sp. JL221]